MKAILRRLFVVCMIFPLPILGSDITGDVKICAIRISFPVDITASTTGDGTFLSAAEYSECDAYPIDPPPHNKEYFWSQIKAVNAYFSEVSYDQFGIDLDSSAVFPASSMGSYQVENSMNYYHPYGLDEMHEFRITELAEDAIRAAWETDLVDFSSYDVVVIFHAGIGQDFSLPFLDPTPEDIPSTFVDSTMMKTHIGSFPKNVKQAIILPETQNHLHYDIAETMFYGSANACEYQYGLTGTFALMLGFAAGLPPLWDTENGISGIGIFGLMDQGSNNGRGLIPAPPTAWTRIFAGWEDPLTVIPGESVSLPSRAENSIVKIDISPTEYFLIENRTNWFRDSVSIDSLRYREYLESDSYPAYVQIVLDSLEITKDDNGVITSVPDYDLGLPASGLLIWHLDETVVQSGLADYSINANKIRYGVDLEESDGAQDIGYPSIFLFSDPSAGYFGDMWFKGNLEYERANPDYEGLSPELGPMTYPDSRSNVGASSYIRIGDISAPNDTMTFTVTNALLASGFPDTSLHIGLMHDFDKDGTMELVGGSDSIWVGLPEKRTYFYQPLGNVYDFSVDTNAASFDYLVINELRNDSTVISFFAWNASDTTFTFSSDSAIFIDDILFLNHFPDESYSSLIYDNQLHSFASTVFVHEADGATNAFKGNSISAADINLDGRADIVYMDSTNTIHVLHYSSNLYAISGLMDLTSIAGFPIRIDSTASQMVLVKDLFGDSHPEIVFQDSRGGILIYNWKGNLEYRLTDYGKLICLGEYGGSNAIVTESAVWVFDNVSNNYGNQWTALHGDFGNSRTLFSSVPISTADQSLLLDKTRTYVYPNPVKGSTATIRVQVESAEAVEISIYDLSGYFVKKANLDYVVEGLPNEYNWNVSNQEPGVYFARVTASKGSRSEEKIIKIGIIK